MTPCSEVVVLLSGNGVCGSLLDHPEDKDLFCKTFNSCILLDDYDDDIDDDDGDSMDDDDFADEVVDCSKLTRCKWDGMHENFLGDGICQKNGCYNTKICDYDHGDCCEDSCTESIYSKCGVDGYQCKDITSPLCDANLNPACAPAVTSEPEPIPQCDGESDLYTIGKFDSWGDGWDDTNLLVQDKDEKDVYTGTLEDGFQGLDYICLDRGCYSVSLEDGVWGNEISWEVKLANGGSQVAHGGAPMDCNFPIGGNECENTCTGKTADEGTKEMTDCIKNKCVIQLGACQGDKDCSPCTVNDSPAYCFTNDLYNSLVDCALCKCSEKEQHNLESETCKMGTPAEKDAAVTSCTSQATLSGVSAVMAYSKCSHMNQVAEMETKWDVNNFGTLDTFESCAHEYATDSEGKSALHCMKVLHEIVTGASEDPEYVKTLATDLYEDAQAICDCSVRANTDSPACASFQRFKTLLHETLDACNALDEIDCAAWDEFVLPCKQNMMNEFGRVAFADKAECDFIEDNCLDVGPFPSFRRLDCGKEISKIAWDFYHDYAEGCLDDGQNPQPVFPPAPVSAPTPPPFPTPENPSNEQKESKSSTAKPYLPPPARNSNPVKNPSTGTDSPKEQKQRNPLLWMLSIASVGGGVVAFHMYKKRQSRATSVDFVRYHRQPQNDGVEMFNGFSAGSFEPPSITSTPVQTFV
eukprot:CAMPEP_0195523864 /NCGR_PEP_ID=MMETSP0794_2-20130614/23321_1 /TAXON_ID=515487 /ORGANISM="Stephanopyxis turris, Strain CCMP 815" /LENGTH=694 /DNA_ID=CAMNT_0040653953 /DNA_START=228 /DNA_END=2312 /DNA_ORIENTATION=-